MHSYFFFFVFWQHCLGILLERGIFESERLKYHWFLYRELRCQKWAIVALEFNKILLVRTFIDNVLIQKKKKKRIFESIELCFVEIALHAFPLQTFVKILTLIRKNTQSFLKDCYIFVTKSLLHSFDPKNDAS